MVEKKKRDKQAEVLEKFKFLEHIFYNFFESLKPRLSWGYSRSEKSRFKLREQAKCEVHYFFRNTDKSQCVEY